MGVVLIVIIAAAGHVVGRIVEWNNYDTIATSYDDQRARLWFDCMSNAWRR